MDLTGEKFNRLLLIERIVKKYVTYYKCICDCGNEVIIQWNRLRSGNTKSCGCLKIEIINKHGNARHGKQTKEYIAWLNMKSRCYNKNYHSYDRYGGRGIKVCNEWLNDFEAFFNHIGKAPSLEHSIDRIDNNGNYEPGNIRWADNFTQTHNRK